MDGFSDGSISVLVTVQTLEEGVDVPDADLAVIVASSKQRRQMIQRMGRIMRRKADGRDARFLLLYVKGTDEDPVMGAHEMFIDELLEVAREANLFELDDIEGLRSFLDPHRI
jgi:superfamily II DNA or RNA helicase